MARFIYKAKNKNNEIISDSIRASNISEAAAKLERNGLVVLEIKEDVVKNTNSYNPYEQCISKDSILTTKEKIEFFNSFYHMFASGLSIQQIFASVMQASKNKKIRGLCSIILKRVERGSSLEEAFEGYNKVLGVAYSRLIVAGESSGKLDKVLLKIISNLKREEELKSSMISSLTYPAMIFVLAIAVFLFFKFFVLKVFSMMGSGVTSCAVMSMLIAAIIKIAVILAVVFGVIFYAYKNKKIYRKILDVLSKFPIVSGIMKNYTFSNFFSILSLAYDAGIPIPNGVELANSVISIPSIKAKISSAVKRILNGCEVTTAFGVAQVFSTFAMSQISAGEKAGELEKMFAVVASDYEKQIDTAIKVMADAVKLFAMIFVGIIVAYVLITAYKSYYSNLFNALGM